jgi:hypothetical protein
MDAEAPEPQIDGRAARFELVAIAVVVLGGYVFQNVWVIPGLAVVLAAGVGFGARANLFNQLVQIVIADRLKPLAGPVGAAEAPTEVRFSELFAVAALTVATLLFVIHLNPLAWVVALVEAGICALHATTGVSVEAAVRDRIIGRRRPR